METSRHGEKFQAGIEMFNSRRFFESHEVWEEIWLHSAEPEKAYLQGIIQIAAAFHHYLRGNSKGTRSLLNAGLRRLETCPGDFRGIALESLRETAWEWAELLGQGDDPGQERIPQIGQAQK
jgi:predicted metal-dependent hydrolase